MVDRSADSTVEYEATEKLPSSKLGTKEYWDEAYSAELANFNDNGDVGEVWFGESSMTRIVKWIKSNEKITKSSTFLDIGCGNGMLLVKLAHHGYTNLTGVDYSQSAVDLASSVAAEEQVNIKYLVCDILNTESGGLCSDQKFDVCLDKGTYDAISLNPDDATGCQTKYINNVSCLLASDGVFIICSCNWTKPELLAQFSNKFEFLESLPAPSFSFGGQSGNTVTTLVFRAKKSYFEKCFNMLTTLPRLRDTKGMTADRLPRLASDRRKKISQVGKVFPKTVVQEKVDEKLDFHCVGLDKDKNVSFPTVEGEWSPSGPGDEVGSLSPTREFDGGTEVTLPELPGILGSRRNGTTPSPDISEPLDLLIKGEASKKSQTQVSLDAMEEPPVVAPEEVMRTNLEPIIDTLFEEDELFAQDFDQDGLNRILFIRKMGIYVEIKTKDYLQGVVCTPLFHCPRCKDHWMEFGTVPENCQFARQPTRGPAIQLASSRKPARKRKAKRKLGDIKEGFIVSGSGTVLNQIDENDSEQTSPQSHSNRGNTQSTLGDVALPDYLKSDDIKLEDVKLQEIDSFTMMEAFKEVADIQKLDKETYVRTVAEVLGFSEDQYDEFARVTIKNAEDNIEPSDNSCNFKAPTLTRPQSSPFGSHAEDGLGMSQAPTANKETYVRTVAEALGFSEDHYDEFARVTIKNAEDNIGPNDNSCDFKTTTLTRPQSSLFGSHAEDGLGTSQAPAANKETYVRTVAEALGFSEDQYDEFARVTIKNAEDNIGPNDNSCDFKTTTLTRPQSSLFGSHAEDGLGTSQAPTANKETYVRTVAESPGFSEDQFDEFARVTVKNAEDNIGPNDNSCDFKTTTLTRPQSSLFGSHAEDGLGTSQAPTANGTTPSQITINQTVDDIGDSFGEFTAPSTNKTARATGTDAMEKFSDKASLRSILNTSMLNSLTVKDLPDRIRVKLLSILRFQRRNRQKQAAPQKASTNKNWASFIVNIDNEESNLLDLSFEDLANDMREISVVVNKNKKNSRAKQGSKQGRSQGQSSDGMSDYYDSPETRRGFAEGGSRTASASGQRYSVLSSFDSDEEGPSTSRSPSDVLGYKELQSQKRSRKKNPSVRNRTGQPDTPFQRPGRHSVSVPNNSASFYSHDDGDSDEENWGRRRAPRVGSSRAHMSDSRASIMSDMSRAPHESDSRTSMLQKYSRVMGSARARKDVSFSNLDDRISYGSLRNGDSVYDIYDDEATGGKSSRARRSIRKKEKGDSVKRPGIYHSKVIQDMAVVQGSPSISHVTESFGDANIAYGSNARLSQARISLTEASSSALISNSTLMNKPSMRPTSSVIIKKPQKRTETPEMECALLLTEESKAVNSIYELPPLEPVVLEASVTATKKNEQELNREQKEKREKLFKTVEKRKPLISLEDLNFIHRLPVSSAFTYSFYELPNHHREHNESIKKAAGRIGRRRKKESGHFRSKSAP